MDTSDIDEMFSALGPVTVKRMFGGQGIYHRGLIVAVVFKGEVLLKADAASAPDFAAAGARRWTYEGRTGKPVEMPYWSVPESASTIPTRWRAGCGSRGRWRCGRAPILRPRCEKGRPGGRPSTRRSERGRSDDHEQPVVAPQVSHFRQVPFRTMVKLAHSGQASPT